MSEILDNPRSVAWSHSHSVADFYELPTDGQEMHEALGWLLQHYESVKFWMGLEREDGTEFLLIAKPPKQIEVVERLKVYEDELSIFESENRPSGPSESKACTLGE